MSAYELHVTYPARFDTAVTGSPGSGSSRPHDTAGRPLTETGEEPVRCPKPSDLRRSRGWLGRQFEQVTVHGDRHPSHGAASLLRLAAAQDTKSPSVDTASPCYFPR